MSPDYFDTGVLLKLYTPEPLSKTVQDYVVNRGKALWVTDLHMTELLSALRLKQFRGEATEDQIAGTLGAIEEDIRNRTLRHAPVSWTEAWLQGQTLVRTHTASLGTRTLDALHVATALTLHCSNLVTTDRRMAALSAACGLQVTDLISAG
jgi:predicted nucleic acid-binding protein